MAKKEATHFFPVGEANCWRVFREIMMHRAQIENYISESPSPSPLPLSSMSQTRKHNDNSHSKSWGECQGQGMSSNIFWVLEKLQSWLVENEWLTHLPFWKTHPSCQNSVDSVSPASKQQTGHLYIWLSTEACLHILALTQRTFIFILLFF